MDPSIPTSFIPKRPVATEATVHVTHSRTVGILSLLTVVVVVATIVSFVGVYLYEQRLEGQKATLEQSITTARDGLGTEFVSDMKRLGARIEGVKALIKSHVVVSPIFAALEETTLRSVQYKDFQYDIVTDSTTKKEVVEVSLTGSAKSYSTIALQSDAFAQNDLIKNPVFSGLTVDDQTSRVDFKLVFTVALEDLSYQTFVDSLTGVTVPQTTQVVQPTPPGGTSNPAGTAPVTP